VAAAALAAIWHMAFTYSLAERAALVHLH